MRFSSVLAVTLLALAPSIAGAQAPAPATPAAPAPAKPAYSTTFTPLRELLASNAAKAVVEKFLPDFLGSQFSGASDYTLKDIQFAAGDMLPSLTNEMFAAMDVELAKIPAPAPAPK